MFQAQNTPPPQTQNNDIAAEFASLVAARLRNPQGPEQLSQLPQMPPGQIPMAQGQNMGQGQMGVQSAVAGMGPGMMGQTMAPHLAQPVIMSQPHIPMSLTTQPPPVTPSQVTQPYKPVPAVVAVSNLESSSPPALDNVPSSTPPSVVSQDSKDDSPARDSEPEAVKEPTPPVTTPPVSREPTPPSDNAKQLSVDCEKDVCEEKTVEQPSIKVTPVTPLDVVPEAPPKEQREDSEYSTFCTVLY